MDKERKLKLLELVCKDQVQQQKDALTQTSRRRGLQKSDIREGHWRCLMDVIKSRITGSSRASDIFFPLVSMMNGLMNGRVYDWVFY